MNARTNETINGTMVCLIVTLTVVMLCGCAVMVSDDSGATGDPDYYAVTFQNWDGTQLQNSMLTYGDMPSYTGPTPTRAADAQYTYTFSGWYPDVTSVTAGAVYTAQFTKTLREYTVTFTNDDGAVVQKSSVGWGTSPVCYTTPVKLGNSQYTYVFDRWYPDVEPVSGDRTYVATYKSVVNEYTVEFKDGDDLLQRAKVAYGSLPVYGGGQPSRPDTVQFSYDFTGWSPALAPVNGDVTYVAQFTKTLREYTVTFVNDDGATVAAQSVACGSHAQTLQGEYTYYSDPDHTTEYTFGYIAGDTTVYVQSAQHSEDHAYCVFAILAVVLGVILVIGGYLWYRPLAVIAGVVLAVLGALDLLGVYEVL